ncbi:surfeit locus protein 1-like isoform X1 [Cucurbita pepo subsp. pepo]|uniref:surfeit locus protein 1-like isoform X1 n=1 Tax=Cucurbita pepo subsp. pepo TaxID=3664 RepID=UPI000C9D78D1|nr:surfeit locus protein 1-like isoform X1 [Cucurbita pepo subsp. pepo]
MASSSFAKSIAKFRPFISLSRHSATPTPLPSSSSSFSSAAAVSSAADPQSSSLSQAQQKQRDSKLSKWLLFLPGALTFGLGTWQIFRRQEKIEILDYRQKRLLMEPVNINSLLPLKDKLDDLEFRRVICKGVFDEKKSIFVGPRSRSISGVTENGHYVITPLMPILGLPDSVQSPVLVNRGWVPRTWKEKALEVDHQGSEQSSDIPPSMVQESERSSWWKFWSKTTKNLEVNEVSPITPVEVIGVVRTSEKPSIFVPANDPGSSQWFYVDVPAIARTSGLPEDAIYVEDINENVNPSNPYPIPKDVNTLIRSSVMPQDHLNYTLTWYSLSAAVTFMAIKRLRQKTTRK